MQTTTTDKPQRSTATFHVDAAQLEEVRDAVVALSGPPTRLTVTDFVREAFARELDRLRKLHQHGKAFPRRDGPPRTGRPVGR